MIYSIMAYLIFYLTNLIMGVKRDIFTKYKRYFFVSLDMIATTNVLMMRLSYRYMCRAPLNIFIYIFFLPCNFLPMTSSMVGVHSYNRLLHHILMK